MTVAVGVPAGLGVVLASHYDALRRADAPIALAADEGERLALWLTVLAAVAAAAAAGYALVERRVAVPQREPRLRRRPGIVAAARSS